MGKYLVNGTGTADAVTGKNAQSPRKDKLIFGSHLNVSKSLHRRPAVPKGHRTVRLIRLMQARRAAFALSPGAGKGPFGCSGDLLAASVLRGIGGGTGRR